MVQLLCRFRPSAPRRPSPPLAYSGGVALSTRRVKPVDASLSVVASWRLRCCYCCVVLFMLPCCPGMLYCCWRLLLFFFPCLFVWTACAPQHFFFLFFFFLHAAYVSGNVISCQKQLFNQVKEGSVHLGRGPPIFRCRQNIFESSHLTALFSSAWLYAVDLASRRRLLYDNRVGLYCGFVWRRRRRI